MKNDPNKRITNKNTKFRSLLDFAYSFKTGKNHFLSQPFGNTLTNISTQTFTKVYSDNQFEAELGILPDGSCDPSHSHEVDVILIPLSKGLFIAINDEQEKEALIGSFYLIPKGKKHKARAYGQTAMFLGLHEALGDKSLLHDF
jgi:quercetin dioxygenase-like cupin family protein